MFLCTRSGLTILPKVFHQNSICIFCSKCESDEENVFFSKRTSKHSWGDVKLSFDYPIRNFRRQTEVFYLKSGNGKKIYVLFPTENLFKTYLRTLECIFDSPARNFWPKFRIVLGQTLWTEKKTVRIFQNVFPRRFLWTFKMQFWQTCRIFLVKSPSVSDSNSGNNKGN